MLINNKKERYQISKIDLEFVDKEKDLGTNSSSQRTQFPRGSASVNLSKINTSKFFYPNSGGDESASKVFKVHKGDSDGSLEYEFNDLDHAFKTTSNKFKKNQSSTVAIKEYDSYFYVNPYSNSDIKDHLMASISKAESIFYTNNSNINSNSKSNTVNGKRISHFKRASDYRLSDYKDVIMQGFKKEDNLEDIIKDIDKRYKALETKFKETEKFLNFGDEDLVTSLALYASNMVLHAEKAYQKFILFPHAEKPLIESLLETETAALKLLKKLEIKLNNLFKEIDIQKNKVKELELQNLKLNEKMLTLGRSSNNNNNNHRNEGGGGGGDIDIKKQDPKKKKGLIYMVTEEAKKKENTFFAEKQKLLAHINVLTNKVKELEKEGPVTQIEKELNEIRKSSAQEIEKLQKIIESKDGKLAKYEVKIGNLKAATKVLEAELSSIQNQNAANFLKATSLDQDMAKFQEYANQKRETALMQYEEILSLKGKLELYVEYTEMARQRLAEKDTKLERLHKIVGHDLSAFEDNPNSHELLQEVKESFKNSQHYTIHATSSLKNEANDEEEYVDLSKYALYQPTFYMLVEDDYKSFLKKIKECSEFDQQKSLFDFEFIALLRGIMDSQYNEYLLNHDPKSYSRFPEFVYSWLSRFDVCNQTRKVRRLTATEMTDVEWRRGKFVQNLRNSVMNKIWDVATFKEFLEENFCTEEIYFYLHCRNLLYEGPELLNFSSTFNIIHYVVYEKAEKLIDTILSTFDPKYIAAIKAKLKNRCKKKVGKLFVDGSLVLRILLEYYKQDRKARLMAIKTAFYKLMHTKGKTDLPMNYELFKKFMDINYSHFSELDKATLYRNAWNIGSGSITYESFFVAATYSNFFIKTLRLRGYKTPPTISPHGVITEDTTDNKICSTIIKNYLENYENVEFIRDQVANIGLEALSIQFNAFQDILDKKFNVNQHEIRGLNWIQYYNEFLMLLSKILHYYQFTNCISIETEHQIMTNTIRQYIQLFELINKEKLNQQADIMEKNSKAKKLQVFLTKRTSNWLNLMKDIFNKKFNKKVNSSLQKTNSPLKNPDSVNNSTVNLGKSTIVKTTSEKFSSIIIDAKANANIIEQAKESELLEIKPSEYENNNNNNKANMISLRKVE